MSGHDDTDTSELRSQLDELKVYIDVEKGKRDEVAAAIIAQRWASKRNEFRLLLENMTVKSKPNAEKAFHEECAEIASQLEEKNKVLAKLGGLIGAAGVNSEKLASMKTGIGIPKYAVEKTAKSFLERQRDDIFMCLLRSSPRIYVLTKEKLDGTMN
ncbi:Zinc finger, C2H2 [Phytophthora cinnamomi]|uniref:Zinc finger, C2H2 n=1 Tax=Phytophthora cinnamomi TaxID=4785 RepID=UPI00355A6D60|nr:Zinc finger, C2H2 [Phytophthora cinnamomi]